MRTWRYGLGALGVAAVLFGLRGLVLGGVATHWPVPAVWLVAGVLVHDLLVVPVAAASGWVLGRVLPAPVRPVVRGGLLVAAVVTVVALPVLSGRGDAGNPSLTPLDYPRNYALVLVAVALATLVVAVVRVRRIRRAG
ncbi:MAG TPA: hypothetical protein VI357_16450 [Mycobacteriales bacterium]